LHEGASIAEGHLLIFGSPALFWLKLVRVCEIKKKQNLQDEEGVGYFEISAQ
jgi:hypothetical protein